MNYDLRDYDHSGLCNIQDYDLSGIVGGRITELRQLQHFTSGRINYGIASNCRKNYMP